MSKDEYCVLRAIVFTSICVPIDFVRAHHPDLSAGARSLMAVLTETHLDNDALKVARLQALTSTRHSVKWTIWCSVIILCIAAMFEFFPAIQSAIGAVLGPIKNIQDAGFFGFVIAAALMWPITAGLQKIFVPGRLEHHPPLRYSLTIGHKASNHFAKSMEGTLDATFGLGTTYRQQRQVIRAVRKFLWVRSAAALALLAGALFLFILSAT